MQAVSTYPHKTEQRSPNKPICNGAVLLTDLLNLAVDSVNGRKSLAQWFQSEEQDPRYQRQAQMNDGDPEGTQNQRRRIVPGHHQLLVSNRPDLRVRYVEVADLHYQYRGEPPSFGGRETHGEHFQFSALAVDSHAEGTYARYRGEPTETLQR